MKQRGRKSAAKLAVVAPKVDDRPEAPDTLLDAEKTLFNAITASRSPGFFDAAAVDSLTEYVRLKTAVELMATQINDFDDAWLNTDEGVKRMKTLEAIRDQKQARMIQYATKLRLTNQSRYVPDKAINRPKKAPGKVWQRDA